MTESCERYATQNPTIGGGDHRQDDVFGHSAPEKRRIRPLWAGTHQTPDHRDEHGDVHVSSNSPTFQRTPARWMWSLDWTGHIDARKNRRVLENEASPATAAISRSAAVVLAEQLKVLRDPGRVQLLTLLLDHPDGEASVGELAGAVRLAGPTVSYHLGVLHRAGMVEREQRGQAVFYRPSHDALARYARLLELGEVQATGLVRVDAVLNRVAEQLAARFGGTFSAETVERYVVESYRMLASRARITRYLPSLTASFAAERLTAMAQAEGLVRTDVPEVLFVCVRNAGRSQLAAAAMRFLAGPRVHVRSAGSEPAGALDPVLVRVLDEIGIPSGGEFPKPLTDDVVRAANYVVTMGCGDACSVYPGRRYIDWSTEDPDGKPIGEVRAIRDDVVRKVRTLLDEILPGSGVASAGISR